MIVESAFFNLPELLSQQRAEVVSEETVRHHFAVALQLELASRQIERPYEFVTTEHPFPIQDSSPYQRKADLRLRLRGVFGNPVENASQYRLKRYGVRDHIWIEVKALLGGSRTSAHPTTANAGHVLRDLIRLSLLPEEDIGDARDPVSGCTTNGRYLLLVTDDMPNQFLALNRRSGTRRWLTDLVTEGESELAVDLENEPVSLRSGVGDGFENVNVKMSMHTHTRSFAPGWIHGQEREAYYWGNLIRIDSFEIEIDGLSVTYQDQPRAHWDTEKVDRYESLAKRTLRLMGRPQKDE